MCICFQRPIIGIHRPTKFQLKGPIPSQKKLRSDQEPKSDNP